MKSEGVSIDYIVKPNSRGKSLNLDVGKLIPVPSLKFYVFSFISSCSNFASLDSTSLDEVEELK